MEKKTFAKHKIQEKNNISLGALQITKSITKNMGNYNSYKSEISLTIDCDSLNKEKIYEELNEFIDEKLQKDIEEAYDKFYEERN